MSRKPPSLLSFSRCSPAPLFYVSFYAQAWESSAEGQKEGAECPLSPIEPVLGYVLEYDTSPDKFVAAVLHAFDAALQVRTYIRQEAGPRTSIGAQIT